MATKFVRRLDANHDMTFGGGLRNFATGAEAAQQRLRCRLLVILGEWFLDTNAGVPWWQPADSDVEPIMGGKKNLTYAETVLKKAILETDGIATIETFFINVNTTTRRMTVSCSVTTVDGGAFTIVDHGP